MPIRYQRCQIDRFMCLDATGEASMVDINLGVICLWVVFKIMRMQKITKGRFWRGEKNISNGDGDNNKKKNM